MMELREKVIRGLACCLPETEEEARLGCGDCPYQEKCGYDYDEVTIPALIYEDIRELLKAEEQREAVPWQ